MIEKYPGNPIVKPIDVPPSRPGLRVLGAFNPGAIRFGDQILLLMRVAERCEEQEGKVRMPFYRFAESTQLTESTQLAENIPPDQSGSHLEIMELDAFDPGSNGVVFAFVVQTDGKIVVAGAFTSQGGQSGGSPRIPPLCNPWWSIPSAARSPGCSAAPAPP